MPAPTPINLPPLVVKNSPNQSARTKGVAVNKVVLHDPEGYYASTSAYIMRPTARVSYHVLLDVDGEHATQFVPWSRKAWSCVNFNSESDNISIAGFRKHQGYPAKQWSFRALNRLARVTAFRLYKRNLPATYLKAPVSHSARGFTYHGNLGSAGGGHADPGFTLGRHLFFVAAVKFHRSYGRFRASWGRA